MAKQDKSTIEQTSVTDMLMLGAIGQSARSTDRAALSTDRAALLKDLFVAQQSVDRSTISRSRNIWQRTCAINRSCGNGLARLAECAGMVLRDRPIVREWFCAVDRSCYRGFARSVDCAGMVLPDRPIVQELLGAIGRLSRGRFHKDLRLIIL